MTKNKQYLGDGVYIDNDGYQLVLSVDDGVIEADTIFIDPYVALALKKVLDEYLERRKPE